MRIHLVDIDSPADAIERHRADVAQRAGEPNIARELRTIERSIRANQQGFEVSTRQGKGSPYLDAREQAIAENIHDIVRDGHTVLAFYGADHVSKAARIDGGPKRDSPFRPLALRLQDAGLRVYTTFVYPLSGRTRWRGRDWELPYTAADGRLSTGQTLDRALNPNVLHYVDRKRERIKLPSQDATNFYVDSYILVPAATPLPDRCAAP